MKKLIFKNLLKDITSFFLLSIISISVIVWVIQAVNYLDFVSEDGHSFRIYFLYTLLSLPKIIGRVLPFMFFLSLFYILLKYEENNELVIFWLNGIKKISFINVILRFSFFFLVIQIFFSSFLIPQTQDLARSFIRTSNIDSFSALIKEKKFIDTVSNLTIFVDSKDKNGNFNKIFLKDKLPNGDSQIIYAEKGTIKSDNNNNFLVLESGEIVNIKPEANIGEQSTKISFDTTELNLSKFTTKTTTFPKIQELGTLLLLNCINSSEENKFKSYYLECTKKTKPYIVQEFFKRVYLPIYIPLLMLIACMQIIKSKDNFDYNRFKTILFLYAVFVLSISEISIRYISSKSIYENIFLILPILLFILNYLFLKKNLSVKLAN
mgnify:CR=1 FL=1